MTEMLKPEPGDLEELDRLWKVKEKAHRAFIDAGLGGISLDLVRAIDEAENTYRKKRESIPRARS